MRICRDFFLYQLFIYLFILPPPPTLFGLSLTKSCRLERRGGKMEPGAGCRGSNASGSSLEESRGTVSGAPD